MLSKMDCFSPLLTSIQWVRDLYLTNVDFELDSLNVVSKFLTRGEENSDFGVIFQESGLS